MADVSVKFLNVLRSRDRDTSVVYEIYSHTILPGADGFNPTDALECFAGVDDAAGTGITFLGRTYKRYVTKHGDPKRSSGPSFNSISVGFSNDDRYLASFVLSQSLGIEGFTLVQRVISRSQSTALVDSLCLFVGACDKALDIDKKDCTISAKQHLGTIDQELPPRKFTPDDPAGRLVSDPLFEGFPYFAQSYTFQYTERVRRGGLGGLLFGLKKNVTRSMQASNHSDLAASNVVPMAIGRVQMPGIEISSIDTGTQLRSLHAFCEGPIQDMTDIRVVTPGFTAGAGLNKRYGYPGGTSGQLSMEEPTHFYPNSIPYSRTAWIANFYYGSQVSQDDPAPDVVSIIQGAIVPLPNSSGVFSLTGFTDNPAYIARWIITDPRLMNLPASFIDDAVCIQTAQYCDQYLIDTSDSDRAPLPNTEVANKGVLFELYNSTGHVSPAYFRDQYLGDHAVNPYLRPVVTEGFDPFDPAGTFAPGQPRPDPLLHYRRRYTANVTITDTTKAVDFLYQVLFPAARLYLTQGANGKIQIRVKKPVDNTIVRQTTALGAVEIPVSSILAWRGNITGKILIGANLEDPATSEVRPVTSSRYSVTGNAITLAATGGVTASGATFSGCDGDQTPATATLTVTSAVTGSTVTIDGNVIAYTPVADDILGSVAGMLAAQINANTTLNSYVKATWDPTAPTIITLQSKIGFLQFTTPTEFAHSSLEEVLRVRMSFSDRASTQSDCPSSNILTDSFKFPNGSKQSTINQIKLTYRSAADDFGLTELRINDGPHQAQIKKTLPKEINGAAIDNYNQAVRIANGFLAELRDGDFFTAHNVEGEGLTIDEGEVFCVTHSAGGFINLPIRVEDVAVKGSDLSATLNGRRYLSSMYDDTVAQRTLRLPTTLSYVGQGPPTPTSLTLVEVNQTATSSTIRGAFTFGAFPAQQIGRVFLKRAGDAVFKDVGLTVTPLAGALPSDPSTGNFEISNIPPGTHEVKVQAEARGIASAQTSAVSITTATNGTITVTDVITNTVLTTGDSTVGGRFDVTDIANFDIDQIKFSRTAFSQREIPTWSSTLTLDMSTGNVKQVNLTGTTTVNVSNLKDGAEYTIIVKQDATGSRTISWNSAFKWVGGTAPTLTTTASAQDVFRFVSNGTSLFETSRNLDVK